MPFRRGSCDILSLDRLGRADSFNNLSGFAPKVHLPLSALGHTMTFP